ncbi:MAG: 16S rRNA (guanine(527)-N(7))-methyltransferase RsmG [Acidobacteriota bacterium]
MKVDQTREFRLALERAIKESLLDPLSSQQIDLLARHYAMLCKWNAKINLTRIIAPQEAARFHYAESILGSLFIRDARRLLDIGSGAGFPALPLAVCNPHIEITALESNQKKSLFLSEVKDALRLENFKVVRGRFEEVDHSAYSLLTCRAIERATEFIPTAIKSLGAGQRILVYCGAELLDSLSRRFKENFSIETKQVPASRSRVIALFSNQINR